MFRKVRDKAAEYMKSSIKVKSLFANPTSRQKQLLHIPIETGTPITAEHIMSIIAYCDMDVYSRKFSESFRKLHPHESFQEVKIRNREYWWQSKLLKEAVEYYGLSGDTKNKQGFESGPFCM